MLGLVINAVTMIFWLAAFAGFDIWLDGFPAIETAGALLAFAIMLVCLILVTESREGKLIRTTVARLPRPPLPEHPDRMRRPKERHHRLRESAQ